MTEELLGAAADRLAPEDVRDNVEKIHQEEGYEVPGNLNEEMMLAFKAMT
jgi:hypothetical protein